MSPSAETPRKPFPSFATGATVGILGGLIGLGGAEFRLPLLITIFGYATLPAVIVNLIVSLVTVFFSFIFRLKLIGLSVIASNLSIIVNILAGSRIGSYFGARLATYIGETVLRRMVVVLLILLSLLLMSHEIILGNANSGLSPLLRLTFGFVAGIAIGAISSLLGVAGGELLIPTIVLLFAIDIKVAGSLSLAISVPTILMGLVKYRWQQQLTQVSRDQNFIAWMVLGSIVGSLAGSFLLQYVPAHYLHILLGAILLGFRAQDSNPLTREVILKWLAPLRLMEFLDSTSRPGQIGSFCSDLRLQRRSSHQGGSDEIFLPAVNSLSVHRRACAHAGICR